MRAGDTDLGLIIWAHDETPSIDCEKCEAKLVADPNGNAPLMFTARELLDAIGTHVCTETEVPA